MSLADLPTQIGTALGADATTGGLILTFAILAMIGFALGVTKLKLIPQVIILFAALAMLTAMQWCPTVVFASALIVFAVLGITKGFQIVSGG